jgi:hypothetical protein
MPHLLATFGGALLQAHRNLFHELRGLIEAMRCSPLEPSAKLAAQLGSVRADILAHFQFEEQNGYMTSVLEIHPHLARAVQHLQADHKNLLRSLDELTARVRSAPLLNHELQDAVITWVGAVQHHERSENVLVQDAFNLDLSAED